MFMANSYRALREDGSDAAFDTKEVKDIAEELDDMMDDIPEANTDEVTNGGIPFTAEMCNLIESAGLHSGSRKWLLEMDVLSKYMESEGVEDPAEAVADVADANSGADPETGEDIVIQQADVVVVTPSSEEVKDIVNDAVTEAKLCGGKKGPACKKLEDLTSGIKNLKNKGIKVARKKSK